MLQKNRSKIYRFQWINSNCIFLFRLKTDGKESTTFEQVAWDHAVMVLKKDSYAKKDVNRQLFYADNSISYLMCGQMMAEDTAYWETLGNDLEIAISKVNRGNKSIY